MKPDARDHAVPGIVFALPAASSGRRKAYENR